MQFSILQSVYKKDNPLFLDECLQSIRDSTLLPEKIILVQDGILTPELEQVIASWKDKLPLHIVGYPQNKGLAHALNHGLRFVETELVARMDSDDICYPDRFEKQVLQFEVDKKLVVLGAGIEEFYCSKELDTSHRSIRLYPKRTVRSSMTLYKGTPVAHPTVMMRTAILKEFGYAESTCCNEDIELWFRLLAAGYEIRTLQAPLLRFRITDDTFRRRSLAKSLDEFQIYSRALLDFNGLQKEHAYLLFRLASRLLSPALIRRLYFSGKRKTLFLEDLMRIKSVHGQVFMKSGHLFEALVEYEEDGITMIKAVQLDCKSQSDNIVEVPLSEIHLYSLRRSTEIQLSV